MDETKKNSILIVEDEETSVMILTSILSQEYAVYAARNGQDGIEMAEMYLPDVILLDIVMPEMDGYAVIKALKDSEITRNIPVIFLTALNDCENEEKALTLGASDYINKPFSSSIVKLRVKNQINIINKMHILFEKTLVETSSHVKLDFLSRMSRKMLSPMHTIMDMTEKLKTLDSSDDTKEYVDAIDVSSRYLLNFINELLDLE